MSLGENIYRLRTAKNMSQGDLADALDVSRQSVSKWENNSAVPELDKLIKMGNLFGVTLDTLVGGYVSVPELMRDSTPSSPAEAPNPKPAQYTSGVVAGAILLCSALIIFFLLALYGSFWDGFFYSLPLFVCGILCLCLKQRRGLWCCWVLFFFVTTVIYIGTGICLELFLIYLFTPYQLIALAVNVGAALLGVWTFHSYRSAAIAVCHKRYVHLTVGWGLTFIPWIIDYIISALIISIAQSNTSIYQLLHICSFLMGWLHLAGVLTMLLFTSAKLRSNSTKED